MSGSCYSCASHFSLFKKEHGCKNCGYSFCKDCLTKKIEVPKHNNEKHKVCNNCFSVLTGHGDKARNQAKYSPPEALKKRLAALENKDNKAVAGISKHHAGVSHSVANKYRGMSKEDIAMAERLEKLKEDRRKATGPIPSQKQIEERLGGLKEDRPPPPNETDMAARLAVLKGQDPEKKHKPFVYKKDNRSQQHQIDDLLDEICAEVDIDSHGINPVADVESRLKHLRGENGGENNLNKSGIGEDKQCSKNIPFITAEEKSASGENMNIEEMNSLMKQVAEEMEVDAQRAIAGLQKDKELMERLNQLKKERKQNKRSDDNSSEADTSDANVDAPEENASDSEDEDKAIKRILKQALEENKLDKDLDADGCSNNLDKKYNPSNNKKGEKKKQNVEKLKDDDLESDPDEFPWCCICNEDATIRCIGCDYDLYCNRCYKEGHDLLDMKEHKTVPYKQKKGS